MGDDTLFELMLSAKILDDESDEDNDAAVALMMHQMAMTISICRHKHREARRRRFGTESASNGSDELKKSGKLKRKARAERFGLPAQTTSDEEMKKARFAQSSKIDTVEEDKKKARALRLSETAPVAPSQVNGNANTEQTAAVAEATEGA